MKLRFAALAFVLLGCEPSESDELRRSAAAAERPAAKTPPAPETWVPEESECEGCHEAVSAQWASSRHHAAYTNPDFARSLAREPLEFCRRCHAPELARIPSSLASEALEVRVAAAEARGVGCLDCHLEGGTLLAGPSQAAVEVPHALERRPDFATEGCARCHEFEFPERSWRPPGTMMQLTQSEHTASPHADRSCADCHMPGKDHGFASTRDPAAMRRAVAIAARREGDELVLELRPVGVGHAFPTGDLFRRLELHAELRGPAGELLGSETRYLARHFAPRRRPDGRYDYRAGLPTPDDRLTGPTSVRLEPGRRSEAALEGAALIWWVDYERVDDRNARAPERSTLADELRLAQGRL